MTRKFAGLFAWLWLATHGAAHAQPVAPQPDPSAAATTVPPSIEPPAVTAPIGETAAAEQRMSAELAVFADQARSVRHYLFATGLGATAALLPAGIVLAKRDNPLQRQVGVGMIVGGAAPFVFTMSYWARPSTLERIRASFEAARVPGGDNRELVRRTELVWQEAAEAARIKRKVSGTINLVLGLAATGVGLGFLLAHPISGMSRNTQYIVGSSLIGPGVPFATAGARSLMMLSAEEASWAAYRAAAQPTVLAARMRVPLGVATLPHGALASGMWTF